MLTLEPRELIEVKEDVGADVGIVFARHRLSSGVSWVRMAMAKAFGALTRRYGSKKPMMPAAPSSRSTRHTPLCELLTISGLSSPSPAGFRPRSRGSAVVLLILQSASAVIPKVSSTTCRFASRLPWLVQIEGFCSTPRSSGQ